ncbi:unnamed protein product, partial [Ascophyllum nodosum]
RGRGKSLFAEAAAFLGVGPEALLTQGEDFDEEDKRGKGGEGGGFSKRRRTATVSSGTGVASGTVQMGFDGGCYLSAQIHNKRYVGVMLDAEEVHAAAIAAASSAVPGAKSTPSLLDLLILKQIRGSMPDYDPVHLAVLPDPRVNASPSARQQQQEQQHASGSSTAASLASAVSARRRSAGLLASRIDHPDGDGPPSPSKEQQDRRELNGKRDPEGGVQRDPPAGRRAEWDRMHQEQRKQEKQQRQRGRGRERDQQHQQ